MLSKTLAAVTFAVAGVAVSAQENKPSDPVVPTDAPLFPDEVLIPQIGDSPLPVDLEIYDCFSSTSDPAYKIGGIDSITFAYPIDATEGAVSIQYWNKFIDESTISELTLYMDTPESSVAVTLPFALVMYKLNEMQGQIEDAINGVRGFEQPWLPVNAVTTTLAPLLATTAPVKEQARVPKGLKIFPIEATNGSVTKTMAFTVPESIDGIYTPSPTPADDSGYGNYEPGNGQQGVIASGAYDFAARGVDAAGHELFCIHVSAFVPNPADPSEDAQDAEEPTEAAPTTTKFLR